MSTTRKERKVAPRLGVEKAPTGIQGLDELTDGGFPRGRPTLIAGGAGCGKTLMAAEFLARGATLYHEPGVLMSFEENEPELTKNAESLGFDLAGLVDRKLLVLDYVRVERAEIEETGEYDLEGLFIRLGHAIDSVGAKRVVLDTIEALFAGLPNEMILRAELRRLFRWLKERGVTAVITGERGTEGTLTRHGLEEYVADCVIVLDQRILNQIATRRLRVVKYRGSAHGSNEYPFLIGRNGISVLPITSVGLNHDASDERVSSGIPRLDTMLGGKGYFRGSSVLISGTAGTGKTSLAASFADAASRRGERVLYFAFEESPGQIKRNMKSVGIDLGWGEQRGLIRFRAVRPSFNGLETHLLEMHDRIEEYQPQIVVVDPITNLISIGDNLEVRSILTRMIDYMKMRQITAVFTSLISGDDDAVPESVGVSSLMDTWILLRNIESMGERNRTLFILKSRGMEHSNQIREFQMSSEGLQLVDVYTGSGEVLTGTGRVVQEARDAAEAFARSERIGHLESEIRRKQRSVEAQVSLLRTELEADLEEIRQNIEREARAETSATRDRQRLARDRSADDNGDAESPKRRRKEASRGTR